MTACDDKYDAIHRMLAQERHDEAISALEQFVTENNCYAPVHYDLGNLYCASGRMERALAHFEKAAELNPEHPGYLKNLADILYSEKGETERALSIYDKILFLRPDDVDTLMVAGHLEVALERFDEALERYTRIIALDPSNEEARQFIDRIGRPPDPPVTAHSPEADYKHCQELVAQGQINEGIACLEGLTQQYPAFALAYNDLGVLYYQRGDKSRCVKNYKKAVAMDPKNPTFLKNLADFYLVEEGAVEKALEIYASVLQDHPEDIDALMVAGHICSAMGNGDSAKTFYQRVLDVEPWNFDAIERLDKFGEN